MMTLTYSDGNPIPQAAIREAVSALVAKDLNLRSRAVAALQLPARGAIDEESSVRRIFDPVSIGAQEDAIFPVDKEGNVEVIISSAVGMPPISMFVTDTVTVNTDILKGAWEMPETLARAGRIDQVERNMRRMVNGFIAKEESMGWDVINACRSTSNTVLLKSSDKGYGSASLELINLMFTKFQTLGYVPNVAFMSPSCMSDLRMLCKEAGLADAVRFDIWRGGMIKSLWGVDFYALRSLSDTYIYMFDTTRFGVMAIRQELETRENPASRSEFIIRVNGQEQVGFAALDKTAVVFGATNKS